MVNQRFIYIVFLHQSNGTLKANGGVPAREIKKRFSEEEIKDLLRIGWGNWDNEKIRNNIEWIAGKSIGSIAAIKKEMQ